MLLNGEVGPGERIAEIPVATKLGVSRFPLRLALERLKHEGLVETLPKGFAACAFTIEDIWDALETRGVLEGAAARLAAERYLNRAQLQPLRKINLEVETLVQSDLNLFTERYLDLNRAFHAGVVALSGSQTMKRTIQAINKLPFTSPGALVLLDKNVPGATELIPIALKHHHDLVEAIEQRQGARAETVAREHSGLTRRNLELALSNWHVMRSIPGAHLLTFQKPSR
jgi:GntR family transcriptional regulator of vanillate catabolism